eukprot:GHUV01025021.1.p2 GENE.GHUV01025021.1~~GHUV01025021.1.p2  ORF type:complete len:172 (+),score=50.51 GHUV01025021.1:1128-1643(+)
MNINKVQYISPTCCCCRDLDSPVDWQLIRRLGNRVAVVCAPQDMWFPMQHYEQLCSEVPEVEEYWLNDLTHAFCMETRQCEVVAKLVLQSVANSLPEQLKHLLQTADHTTGSGAKQTQQQLLHNSSAGATSTLGQQPSGAFIDMVVEVQPDRGQPDTQNALKLPQAVRLPL